MPAMDANDNDAATPADLRQKLNFETAKLSWPELQRHFARGVVIVVTPELDLIEAAATFAENNRAQTEQWIRSGRLSRASDTDARRWQERSSVFWAVVVAPWVLVQEIGA
jgi:hypothetical protein